MSEAGTVKKGVFWAITLLFPFLILLLIELGLRAGGYNDEIQDAFVEYRGDDDYMVFNHEFVTRYFPSFKPSISPTPFRKNKQPNTFRVFVFGGSSTEGFPYNFYYSFANQLEQKLLLDTNGLHVEVINLGMTAVNSYVIRDLSKRVRDYDPDAVIIYAGHNEYYGSFGAGTTQFGLINSVPLKRLVLYLKNFRLFQLIENALKADTGGDTESRTLMSKVIRESEIVLDGEVFEAGLEQFNRNIEDVINNFVDDGVPVYIGTLASNLKDQPPLESNEQAIAAFERGNQLYEAGDTVSALAAYLEAKELDGIRFRAPKAMNEYITGWGESDGVEVVDIQNMLRKASGSGIEDNSMFTDHLHPNAKGHRLMADLFKRHLMELDKVKNQYVPNSFDIPGQVSRFEAVHSNTSISRLLAGYPFQKGLTVEEELSAFNKIYEGYRSGNYTDSLAAVTARTNSFVPEALTKVVNQAREQGDSAAVITHYYELLKWQLNNTDLIEKGIEYAVNNREMDTYLVNMITQILNDGNYDSRYMDVLSSVYLLNNDLDKAGFWLKESEQLNPDSITMLYNFARYHILAGDTTAAQRYYVKYLNLSRSN